MTPPVLPPVARTHYFTGEALLTDDFICEQRFNMGSLAAVNASLHTFGIAAGLDVQWQSETQPNQVHVAAGMAIDRLGREIILSEPRLISLSGIEGGATYYLTIRYHEVYGDLSDGAGVPGYKRVIQDPQITCERTLRDPGIDIMLAVLTFTTQGTINSLTYKSGRNERRYVGGRFGSLQLVAEGAGLSTVSADGTTVTRTPGVQLVARRETDNSGLNYLEVEAERCQISGQLTTRGDLGIGEDHPTANLQITTVTRKGLGTFTTKGTLLTLSVPVSPPLQPGDLFIPDVSPALPQPQPPQAVIASIVAGGRQYTLVKAFNTDFTTPTRFTYVRTTLARFSDPKTGDLLSVRSDGTLWLGILAKPDPGTTNPGPGVLSITSNRRVGIGLSGSATPQASLQVAGGIVTDQLTSNGAVKAQSFEGNGSKLTNLSIISYWTRTNVSATSSPLYYDQGNVGVQMTTPPGTLSAGTRAPFVGSGLISWDKDAEGDAAYVISGFQTLFTSELAYGDSITVGKLVAQAHSIATITSDTELTLDVQYPVVIQKSAYGTLAANAAAGTEPTPGAGTVSSQGTTIIGDGTRFTSLKPGDFLVIEAFQPVAGLTDTWMVASVQSDTSLTLQKPVGDAKPNWEANASAYMISSGLMGYFQSNEGQPLSSTTTVPALIVKANGDNADTTLAENTVAINMKLEDTDPHYALQVSGDVSFNGSSSFDDLSVQNLTVTKSLTVSGDNSVDPLVSIKEAGAAAPLLTVTKSNVQIGATGSGTSMLCVGGDIAATGAVTGASLSGGTVTSTGAITCGGSLSATGGIQSNADIVCDGRFYGDSLLVAAAKFEGDGTVVLFNQRQSYNQNNLTNNTFTQTAATDGFVLVVLGTVDPNLKTKFASMLTATTTTSGGTVTCTMVTAASTNSYTFDTGKKGSTTLQIPTYGTITMPVRKGEIWSLTKTDTPSDAGLPAANLVFYWVPLGGVGQSVTVAARAPTASADSPQAHDDLTQSATAFHANVQSQQPMGTMDATAMEETQRIIDDRVEDFTRVLGDATGMDPRPDARAAFIHDLQMIVCRAQPPGTEPDNRLNDDDVRALIDTLGRVTGHQFTPEEHAMVDAGVRALVEINANDRNRRDLDLIKSNIGFFLDSMETAMGRSFDTRQRRLLTRALVRLVGDGTQGPRADDVMAVTETRRAAE